MQRFGFFPLRCVLLTCILSVGFVGVANADDGASSDSSRSGDSGDRGAVIEVARVDGGSHVVQITGANLLGVNRTCQVPNVSLGSSSLKVTKATSNSITAVVPSGILSKPGTYALTLKSCNQGNGQAITIPLTVGPQGGKGATGATGSAGASGATGAAGIAGLGGRSGATGPTGPTGPTGASATGAVGLAGASGGRGATGAVGPTGVAGATGARGLAGPQVPRGRQGFLVRKG